jgi:peptidoglycan/LPS O-acetylase OafA/YrhL
MFGTFRLLLAIAVLVTHIGGIEILAGQAVWGFFMLSGFLMTAVLQSKYHFSRQGMIAFTLSRFIRLFPTYWATVGVSALCIFAFHDAVDPSMINEAFNLPDKFIEYFSNIFIVGHTIFGIGRIENALSPSAWAVDVEILMYVCSCIFLSRSQKIAKITAITLMAAYPLTYLFTKLIIQGSIGPVIANQLLYSFIPSALLPYAIGCWLWFRRDHVPSSLWGVPAILIASISLMTCAFVVSRFSVTGAYLLSLPCLFVIIAVLAHLKGKGRTVTSLDTMFGRMSYPVYLLQWVASYLVVVWSPAGLDLFSSSAGLVHFSVLGFFAVLGITLGISLLMALVLEGPIENLRPQLVNRLTHLRRVP